MMTREQYQELTDFKDIDDARECLFRTRVLFVIVFTLNIASAVIAFAHLVDPDLSQLISFGYLVLLVFFARYCFRVVKRTKKVTKADPLLSFLFAPISWIWFYPALVLPLRIIVGDIPPPDEVHIKKVPTPEEKKVANRLAIDQVFKAFLIVGVVVTFMIVGAGLIVGLMT